MLNLSEINQLLPLFVIVIQFLQFGVLSLIVLRQLKVIDDNTLGKAPAVPHQVPATRPIPAPDLPAPKPCPPVSDVVIDQGLVDFIKKTEGFTPTAKWDYKQYSIGYGTKASDPNETITEAEAEIRLRAEIAKADALVTSKFPNLPKGQHQALLDLTYNAGPGWENGALGAAVKAQKIDTIKADILQYDHAGGQVLAGLKARRETEVSWFDNPL